VLNRRLSARAQAHPLGKRGAGATQKYTIKTNTYWGAAFCCAIGNAQSTAGIQGQVMKNENYEVMHPENDRYVYMWTQGVLVEAEACKKLESIAGCQRDRRHSAGYAVHTSPVARKKSAGRIPGGSTVHQKRAGARAVTSPEYGHKKPWPSSGLLSLMHGVVCIA
jgi:hypothetical protein